jgi:hypothetical protein
MYQYTFPLPSELLNEWSWFEHRGYLPEMPGELVEHEDDAGSRYPYSLEVPEHEAWEFQEAALELGEGFCTCLAPHLVDAIQEWLDMIV